MKNTFQRLRYRTDITPAVLTGAFGAFILPRARASAALAPEFRAPQLSDMPDFASKAREAATGLLAEAYAMSIASASMIAATRLMRDACRSRRDLKNAQHATVRFRAHLTAVDPAEMKRVGGHLVLLPLSPRGKCGNATGLPCDLEVWFMDVRFDLVRQSESDCFTGLMNDLYRLLKPRLESAVKGEHHSLKHTFGAFVKVEFEDDASAEDDVLRPGIGSHNGTSASTEGMVVDETFVVCAFDVLKPNLTFKVKWKCGWIGDGQLEFDDEWRAKKFVCEEHGMLKEDSQEVARDAVRTLAELVAVCMSLMGFAGGLAKEHDFSYLCDIIENIQRKRVPDHVKLTSVQILKMAYPEMLQSQLLETEADEIAKLVIRASRACVIREDAEDRDDDDTVSEPASGPEQSGGSGLGSDDSGGEDPAEADFEEASEDYFHLGTRE